MFVTRAVLARWLRASMILYHKLAACGQTLRSIRSKPNSSMINSVRGYPFPDSTPATGMRSTLAVRVRLPTGARADTFFLLVLPRQTGHFGVSADLYNDFFLSRKFWVTASAGYTQLSGADVLRFPFSAERPFPADTSTPATINWHHISDAGLFTGSI